MTVEQTNTPLAGAELERACTHFLYREAELLDAADYTGWIDTCVSQDLEYLVPIRTTRERAAGVSEFSREAFHMRDTFWSIRLRVDRLLTEHAWAEDPPSRTRRVVTNVRVRELGPGEVEVKSYLMLHRSQWDTADYDLLVADRHDVLRSEAGEWRLRRREVLLNHTILGTANLGVFL
ncbi:3-phenylpropionate/cinnamic acid dioxygenase subunit beta [Streptomyces sp. NPDC005799]|uniref:aromatic-ring-hydroxylating dioxygenase subunit beta n=1 Tax=Streptomyces sp. NPDC005799 TaxID=3154678 RepID=UPI0033F6104C